MTQPTRQQMLSAIKQKIARTSPTEYPNIVKIEPVMIGDVLDWLEINEDWNRYQSILSEWSSKRLPLEWQDDECVSYIYSLL